MSDAENLSAGGAARSRPTRTDRKESERQSSATQLKRPETSVAESEVEFEEPIVSCPECDGRLLEDAAHGETACQQCGLVLETDAIDHGPEWTSVGTTDREQVKRTGSPRTQRLHDNGLATTIGWEDRDAKGNTLNANQRAKMSRLRTWDTRFQTKDSKESNSKAGLAEIDRMGSALGISDSARETACIVFKRAHEERLLIGRSIEAVATGSLYAAARMNGLPRTLDGFVQVSRIKRLSFERAYLALLQTLELPVEPTRPEEFLPQFIDELSVSDSDAFEQAARELLISAREVDPMSGRSPSGLAASALYATACVHDEPVTQEELSKLSDTSKVTIRIGYQDLLDVGSWE